MTDKWGIVIGNYGDVICELGIFQDRFKEGNLIYYGHQPYMYEFLSAQDFIHKLKVIYPETPGAIGLAMRLLWSGSAHHRGVELVLRGTDILPSQIIDCSINYDVFDNWDDVPVAKNLKIPEEAKLWATEATKHIKRPWYVVQPYSINTNNINMHWPFWGSYLAWLLEDRSKTFLMCGTQWDSSIFKNMNRVVNLVDKTPTICHMFALAQLADGVITTSNSLAHFCAAQNIPTLVNGPYQSLEPKAFFRKAVCGPKLIFHDFYTKLTTSCYSTYEKFGIWPTQ